MDLKLFQSNKLEDWALASEILTEVVAWLNSQGTPLWQAEQITRSALADAYTLEELYFITCNGQRIGLVFLQESDPLFWPEIESNNTLFVHKLCLRGSQKGLGLGSQVLKLIQQRANEMGKVWLRLDCDDRLELHTFYKTNGFTFLDFKTMEKFVVARYQLRCE